MERRATAVQPVVVYCFTAGSLLLCQYEQKRSRMFHRWLFCWSGYGSEQSEQSALPLAVFFLFFRCSFEACSRHPPRESVRPRKLGVLKIRKDC